MRRQALNGYGDEQLIKEFVAAGAKPFIKEFNRKAADLISKAQATPVKPWKKTELEESALLLYRVHEIAGATTAGTMAGVPCIITRSTDPYSSEIKMIFDAVRKTERRLRKTQRHYSELLRKGATTRNSTEQQNALLTEASLEIARIEEELLVQRSNGLTREAGRLKLPVPAPSDTSAWQGRENLRYLTPQAQAQLRRDIREEKKERRDIWASMVKDVVVPIGGLIVSILSLLVAYAAVRLKSH